MREFMVFEYGDDKPHKITEEQVLKEYFPYWADRMVRAGKALEISEKNCIDDWIAVNWGWEVTK